MTRDFTSQLSHPFVLRTPGHQNAEMFQYLFLQVFMFHEIRMQGISLLFGILDCRNVEMSRCLFFQVFMFRKTWVQGKSMLPGNPGCQMPKCQTSDSFGVRSRDHNNPWDLRSMSDLAISLFCDLGFWETRILCSFELVDSQNHEMDQSIKIFL
jgi:hypothetical protein